MKYSEFIKILNKTNYEENINLHHNLYEIIKDMDSLNFISEVIELNLSKCDFLNKKWTYFDIPFLNIFNNGLIDLKYHLFFPNKFSDDTTASHMIHNHKSSVLSSYVFYGAGYHTIHFSEVIQHQSNNCVEMKITKDFFHSKGSFNIVYAYEPHLVSNVSEPTFTIALWTLGEEDSFVSENSDLRAFYLEKNRFKSISDSDFLKKTSHKTADYVYEDFHIQGICYFIQQVGYLNTTFLKSIIKEKNLNDSWSKWISKLIAKEYINYPIFNEDLNFINKSPKLSEIRNAVSD